MKNTYRSNSPVNQQVRLKAKATEPYEEGKPFDGARLHDLGYTDFKPGITYILYDRLPNTGGLRPMVIFPHDDGSFESTHYTCTFVDRDMEIVPAALYFHPHHFPFHWLNLALVNNAKKLADRKRMERFSPRRREGFYTK